MFTGIIEELGQISSISESSIGVEAKIVLEGTKIGDSISVNGVCLTVTNLTKNGFTADISSETSKVTALKYLKFGSLVNLERALTANGRFGGHIVSGHIDSIGKIVNIRQNGAFYDLELELDSKEQPYVVKKGSIAVNGISLTVAEINANIIKLAIIPHTFENTSLKILKSGDFVNIETDILAKYVEKILSTGDNRTGIDMEFLHRNGF